MNTNGKPRAKDPNVVASFSGLAHDVLELAELQSELLSLDVAAAWQRMRVGVVLTIVGGCLLLGCLPVVLLTVTETLVEYAGWSRTGALAAAAAGGLLAAGGILAAAWFRMKTMLVSFERSREELSRNLAWIKSSLRDKSTPQRIQRPADVPLPS
jgi:hypothetical protein